MKIIHELPLRMNEWGRLSRFLQGKYGQVKEPVSLFLEQMTIQAFVGVHPVLQPQQWFVLPFQASEIDLLSRTLKARGVKLQEWIRWQLWKALQLAKIDPSIVGYDLSFPTNVLSPAKQLTGNALNVPLHSEISGVLENLANEVGVEKEILVWTALLSSMPEFFFNTPCDYQIALHLDILEHIWLDRIVSKFGIEVKTEALKRILLLK